MYSGSEDLSAPPHGVLHLLSTLLPDLTRTLLINPYPSRETLRTITMIVEPDLEDPSGMCFKCWSSTYAGYICPTCNMSRCVAFKDVKASEPLPCDVLARTYVIDLANPPRPHQLLVLTQEALGNVLTRIGEARHNYDYHPVPEFGVCAVMHHVGPKGGFCPRCDQMGGFTSRLRRVTLGEEYANYDFHYRGLCDLPGVSSKRALPAGTATAVEPDLYSLQVGLLQLTEIFTDVIHEPLPATQEDFLELLVTRNILSHRFEGASQGDPRAPADVSNPQTIAPIA